MCVLCIVSSETPQLKGCSQGDHALGKPAGYSEAPVTPMCVIFGRTNCARLISKDGRVQGIKLFIHPVIVC